MKMVTKECYYFSKEWNNLTEGGGGKCANLNIVEINEICNTESKATGYKHCVLVDKVVSHSVRVNNFDTIILKLCILKLNN